MIEWLRDAGGLSATATDDAAAREAVEDVRRRLLAHAQFLRRKEASLLRQRAASADHDARGAARLRPATPRSPRAATMPASTFKKLVVPEWAKDEREYAYVWPALPGAEQAPLS